MSCFSKNESLKKWCDAQRVENKPTDTRPNCANWCDLCEAVFEAAIKLMEEKFSIHDINYAAAQQALNEYTNGIPYSEALICFRNWLEVRINAALQKVGR